MIVEVSVAPDTDRNYSSLVKPALSWWEDKSTGYELKFRLADDAGNPDVQITVVEEITECGVENGTDIIGCADYVPRGEPAPDPTEIRIEAGWNNSSTTQIAIHEIGHTLGYTHNDTDEFPVMNATTHVATVAQPNATEREWFWRSKTVTVAFDQDSTDDQTATVKEEVQDAVSYYQSTPSPLPDGYHLEYIENETAADIVVVAGDPKNYMNSTGSLGYYYGFDPDEDGALEYYSNATIYIDTEYRDHVGWHTGYWLGLLTYSSTSDSLAPLFIDPDPDDYDEPE